MATRKYDDETMVKAVKAMPSDTAPDRWEKFEARKQALEVARALSEIGSRAEDVVADAKVYYEYIIGDR